MNGKLFAMLFSIKNRPKEKRNSWEERQYIFYMFRKREAIYENKS